MSKPTLLICGDSFSYPSNQSWASLLSEYYDVRNLSQPGCSEYRIWKQINSIDYKKYDHIIICHTSPYRIYTEEKLIEHKSNHYQFCDLIYTDANNRIDETAQHIKWMFKNVISLEYQDFIHSLLLTHYQSLNKKILHVTFFNLDHTDVFSFADLWKKHNDTDSINHLSPIGNRLVLEEILKKL